jgi:hypothetical protein
MAVIGGLGGWGLVTAWLPDSRGRLRASATWGAASLAALAEANKRAVHAPESTVLGTALYASAALWRDASAVEADERLAATAEHGITTALVVPVRAGIASLGVLECLSASEVVDVAELGPAFEAVGLQLGQFIALARARRSVGVR